MFEQVLKKDQENRKDIQYHILDLINLKFKSESDSVRIRIAEKEGIDKARERLSKMQDNKLSGIIFEYPELYGGYSAPYDKYRPIDITISLEPDTYDITISSYGELFNTEHLSIKDYLMVFGFLNDI